MLWPCSCQSRVGVLSKQLNILRWFAAYQRPLTYPTQCWKDSLKNEATSLCLSSSQHVDLHKWCQLSMIDNLHQFITLSIRLCLQHDRRASLSATAETYLSYNYTLFVLTVRRAQSQKSEHLKIITGTLYIHNQTPVVVDQLA